VGKSADRGYSVQLQQDKWPQAETTGSVLRPPTVAYADTLVDLVDVEVQLEAEFDPDLQDFDGSVSARPCARPHRVDDDFDALQPDDLGARFLARATQAPSAAEEEQAGAGEFDDSSAPWEWSQVSGEQLGPDGSAVMSEASLNASRTAADDEEVPSVDPLSVPIDVDVPAEVWDVEIASTERGTRE
jgi:hypothetical protein